MSSIPNSGFTPGFVPQVTDGNGAVCEQFNSLLRGEISAAETYKMAIDKLSDSDRSRQ